MSSVSKKVTIPQVKKFLVQTGFPFEMKMAKIFKDQGYDVEVGKFFMDLEGSKEREIDIIASKEVGKIWINFIVECKQSFRDEWIFFSPEDDPGRYADSIKHIPSDHSKTSWNGCFNRLHIFDPKILLAKNFVTCMQNGGKLKQTKPTEAKKSDPTELRSATQKVIKSTIAFVADLSWKETRNLVFPVVVFSKQLFIASYPGALKVKKENHIQFALDFKAKTYNQKILPERQVPRRLSFLRINRSTTEETIRDAHSSLGIHYLIDIVNGARLNNFLKLVERGVSGIDLSKWTKKEKP